MNEKDVRKILEEVKHPEIDASLIELGMIKDVKVEENKAKITMAFPFPGIPIKDMLVDMVKQPLEKEGMKVEINERIMNENELQKFFKMEQEKWKGQ